MIAQRNFQVARRRFAAIDTILAASATLMLAACSADSVAAPNGAIAAHSDLSAITSAPLACVGDSATIRGGVVEACGATITGSKFKVQVTPAGVLDQVGPLTFRAVRNGTVKIVAEIDVGATGVAPGGYWADRVADSITVQVKQLPARITFAPLDTAFTMLGAVRTLKATVTDARGNALIDPVAPLSWQTSDGKIATVDSVGVVRSVAEGNANITATVQSLSARATFSVRPRLAHTSCMVYAPRKQTRQSCVTLDFVVRAPAGGK